MAKTWQVILATLAIFIAGLVCGSATTVGLVRWAAAHRRANAAVDLNVSRPAAKQANGMQPFNPQTLKAMAEQLNLTPEQKMRIMPIVRRTAAQLQRERREVQLTSALLLERMQDEIADLLTPQQRAQFEQILSERRQKLEQLRQGLQQQQQAQPDAKLPQANAN
jgi:Spy/CpxP family protein refolding chaperone